MTWTTYRDAQWVTLALEGLMTPVWSRPLSLLLDSALLDEERALDWAAS